MAIASLSMIPLVPPSRQPHGFPICEDGIFGTHRSHSAQLTLMTRQCRWLSVNATIGSANDAGGGCLSRRANAICPLREARL